MKLLSFRLYAHDIQHIVQLLARQLDRTAVEGLLEW